LVETGANGKEFFHSTFLVRSSSGPTENFVLFNKMFKIAVYCTVLPGFKKAVDYSNIFLLLLVYKAMTLGCFLSDRNSSVIFVTLKC
jgi:hypothetical protein